jgi:predicted nucleotidyltransferase
MIFKDSILKVLSTRVKISIIRHFLSGPPKMSEREIAKALKLSHMSVNRAVNELKSINFLSSSRAGNINLWEVNESSFSYKTIKRLLQDFSDAINPLFFLKKTILKALKGYQVQKVTIYGSIAGATEEPGSDIDLLIVVGSDKEKAAIRPAIEKLEKECLLLFGNPLSPYLMAEKEYRNKRNLPVIKKAESGIMITGTDNVK